MKTIKANELARQCSGRWFSIFANFGISIREDNRHSACPICGPGKNNHRFRVDNKENSGSWICTQCGAGDGIALVQKVCGFTFPETLEKISEIVGCCKVTECNPTPKKDPRIAIEKIIKASVPLTGSDMVSRYLHGRNLTLRPNDVKMCPKCWENETRTNMTAMIAAIRNPNGRLISLHRTYLQNTQKADIKSPKKIMPVIENLNGSAVRLFEPGSLYFEKGILGIAEGVETAIAATQRFQIATWACLSSTVMESFKPPEKYREIVIFGDNDSSFTGQASAYLLAKKLYAMDLIVSVEIPETIGDWAD